MKKLLAMYKGLPKEFQMLLAMAGLGSPIGAIWLLQRFVFPGVSLTILIFGVAAAVGVICLVVFLLSRVFGRGARSRTQRMAAELARDDQAGPTSVDVRASIKANNEKFFTAIRDMRKNLGISVYDLPWYIVIGDSGCGKTRLVNNGGLTFSTGKPEGYQLGTLNYNWWFTEDAVFVDMAGRLCNPQEDADHKEWQAFLDTISRGRKGFPINGAIVCVSAEHLLQDSPEKHEADANTALERLREMQTKLGVTFATYLVITKCDKILGFMQFFDRAERDITVKNQIFGWSKPGPFNELYDPERFQLSFEELYGRLNDLRLRRLHDEVSEVDLGLAYSFPEEFRELRDPLHTYVRTLFPHIKNPRAVKNLIFRGIYFTSATQEGEVILKHITERLGAEVASQFPTLDTLYPEKRPLFVKEIFFRKVFPEHGLVFRNEDDVIRNRKLARLLKFGSAGLAVLLILIVVWSAMKVNQLVVNPRLNAAGAREKVLAAGDALDLGAKLDADVETLRRNRLPAMLLTFFVGADAPIRDLTTIRMKLFEEGVLRKLLVEVDAALRAGRVPDAAGGADAQQAGIAYLDAVEQFLLWFGCREAATAPPAFQYEGLLKLSAIVSAPESPSVKYKESFEREARSYFVGIADRKDWPNPSALLPGDAAWQRETVRLAIGHAHKHLERYATVDDRNPNPLIREWMRLRKQCGTVDEGYARMLDAARTDPETREDLQALKETFLANYDSFARSLDECRWMGESTGFRTIIKPMRDAIPEERRRWLDYEKRLADAYARCAGTPHPDVQGMIVALSAGSDTLGMPGLDKVMWLSLRAAELTDREYGPGAYEKLPELVREVDRVCTHVFTLRPGEGTEHDSIVVTEDARKVREKIKTIRDRLADARLEAIDDASGPAYWIDELDRLLDAESVTPTPLASLGPQWRRAELNALEEAHQFWIARGLGTRLLATMEDRLKRAGSWGFAEVMPAAEWTQPVRSAYAILIPERSEVRGTRRTVDEAPEEKKEEPRGRRGRAQRPRRGQTDRSAARPTREPVRTRVQGDKQIPACASREFLDRRIDDMADLSDRLRDFNIDFFFTDDAGKPLNEVCLDELHRATATYFDAYVSNWAEAYRVQTLPLLEGAQARATDWKSLGERMKGGGPAGGGSAQDMGEELRARLEEFLRHVPFWAWCKTDAGAWDPCIGSDGYWAPIAGAMQAAIDRHRPSDGGRFFDRATLSTQDRSGINRGLPPWQLLSDEFVRLWGEISGGIARNADLPRKFEQNPGLATRISWGQIEALRQRAGLEDEKFTGALVNFERRAQLLLSVELNNVLYEVQDRYFGGLSADRGWPYLPEDGDGKNALRTVDFEKFRKFLVEVDLARESFRSLEEGLPEDDELRRARLAFYQDCRNWLEFIGLTEQAGKSGPRAPRDVALEIWGGDPTRDPFGKEKPDDSAQHYYADTELSLGLHVDAGGGDFREGPFVMATETERKVQKRRAQWRWTSRAQDAEVSVKLMRGLKAADGSQVYPELKRVLGTHSPLALCAFLHRYGVPHESEWIVAFSFDLVDEFQKKSQLNLVQQLKDKSKTKVGDKYIFRFVDRPMPGPIRPLGRPANPGAS